MYQSDATFEVFTAVNIEFACFSVAAPSGVVVSNHHTRRLNNSENHKFYVINLIAHFPIRRSQSAFINVAWEHRILDDYIFSCGKVYSFNPIPITITNFMQTVISDCFFENFLPSIIFHPSLLRQCSWGTSGNDPIHALVPHKSYAPDYHFYPQMVHSHSE